MVCVCIYMCVCVGGGGGGSVTSRTSRDTKPFRTNLFTLQPLLNDVGLVVGNGYVITDAQHVQQVQEAVVLMNSHKQQTYCIASQR